MRRQSLTLVDRRVDRDAQLLDALARGVAGLEDLRGFRRVARGLREPSGGGLREPGGLPGPVLRLL